MTARVTIFPLETTPTAEHIARALVAAAQLTGELDILAAIRSPARFRNTALRARALAYRALLQRFPLAPSWLARRLGVSTAWPHARTADIAVVTLAI